MKLINTGTNEEIIVGEIVTDFRGDQFKLRNFRGPNKPSSTGRVGLDNLDGTFAGEYFPSVINAKIVADSHVVSIREAANV